MAGRRPRAGVGGDVPGPAGGPVGVAARASPPAPDLAAAGDAADATARPAVGVDRPAPPSTRDELVRVLRARARSAWTAGASRLSECSRPAPETASARLVISVASLSALAVGVLAVASGVDALRVAALLFFCVVGIGAAPWQVDTGLRLAARLTVTAVTSIAVLTLGSMMMLTVAWTPTLAFGILVAACVPLHVLGVHLALRDSAGLHPAWEEARSGNWVHVAVAGVGAVLCFGSAAAHGSIDPRFFGYLTQIGPVWYAGLALVLIAVAAWPPGREREIAIPVLLLLVVVTLTPALLYEGPRSQSAGKHVDLVVQIVTRHRLDTSVDIYEAWPGFFGATAWLSEVTGVRDPMRLATFWPPLLALFRITALRYLFGQFLRSAHQAWIAVALAILVDPIGADYFSPQSVAFVLALAVFGLALTTEAGLPRLSLIAAAGCVLAVSHQLTPYAVAAVLTVLVAFRLVRPWWTPLLVLAPALAWAVVHRRALEGFVSWDDLGAWGNFRPPTTTASAGLERLPVVRETVLALVVGIVVVGLLALVALVRGWRDRRLWALACCPAAGMVLVVINPYGQEGIFRATLFGLPWLALLAAHAFPPMHRRGPRLVLAAVLAVLAWTFLVASSGLDAANVVRRADVAAYRHVQREATSSSVPSYVLSLADGDLPSFLPPEDRAYEAIGRDDLELPRGFPRLAPDQQVDVLTEELRRYARETTETAELYALWSPASGYHDWAYGVQTPRQFAAVRDAFGRSPDWEVVLDRDGTWLFRLQSAHVTTGATGG
jgi:hypothetical protein